MEQDTLIQTDSYLVFELAAERFSVNVGKVNEIIEIPKITKVPQSPEYMKGVINIRGNVIPVVDTRQKFGFEPAEFSIDTSIVIMTIFIEEDEVTVGAIVDKVLDVVEFKKEDIQDSPSLGHKYKSEFIVGMGKSQEHFIMILNIDKIFSTDELSILKDHTDKK